MKYSCLFCLSFACLFAVGCQSDASNSGKLRVVATTTILSDAVRQVGGDHVLVTTLMGPGIDPHRYTATPGDIRKLAAADLILFHGLHLEGKMDDVLASQPQKRAVAICERIDRSKLRGTPDGSGVYDPHVWMDPRLWCDVVGGVRDELTQADPANAEQYAKHAANLITEILRMHEENREVLKDVPAGRRVLVTSHDAFAYFGDAYGFMVRGLQGISTAAESGTKDVQELADFLGVNQIPAVFTETSVPSKGLEAVLDSVRKKHRHTVKLVSGQDALYSDSLGEKAPCDTYIGMMRHNVAVIARALK